MVEHFVNLIGRLGHWGYLVIFAGTMLESAGLLGLVVPGETLMLLGGFLCAQHVLDLGDLMIVGAIGAVIGDSIGYEVGRHFGRAWLLQHVRWTGLSQRHFQRVDRFFGRHGGKTVLIGRFVGVLRALVPYVAGSSRMQYGRFLLYNAVGAATWSVALVLLGYSVGAGWQVVEHWVGRASAVLGGIIVLLIVLGWLWRWAVRHESALRTRWSRIAYSAQVVAVRRRTAPVTAFLQARLSPGGYLGLRLTVGVLVIMGAAWVFGGIVQDVLAGDPLTKVDHRVAIWLHAHATASLTAVMRGISEFGAIALIASAAGVVGLLLALARQWYRLLALVLCVPGGMLLNVALQHVFRRPRPESAHPLAHLSTYSFPSGHAIAAILFYGFLACLLVTRMRDWRGRVELVLGTVFLVIAVDFSRLYLGADYLSDVLGADAAGLAWLALVWTGVNTWRRAREPPEAAVAQARATNRS